MCARDDTCHSQIKPTLPRFLHSLDSLGSSGFCGCLRLSHCHFSTTPLILLCLEISSSSKNFNYTRFFHFHNNINLFLKKMFFMLFYFLCSTLQTSPFQASFEWQLVFLNGSVTVSSIHRSSQSPQPITEFVFQKLMADAAKEYCNSFELCNTQWQTKRLWGQGKSCCCGFIFNE